VVAWPGRPSAYTGVTDPDTSLGMARTTDAREARGRASGRGRASV